MNGFSRRERKIILDVYADAARICWERTKEPYHGKQGISMAEKMMRLMAVRANQILKYGCALPSKVKTQKCMTAPTRREERE